MRVIKQYFTSLLLIFLSFNVFAQKNIKESEVPKPVLVKFQRKFKDISKVTWQKNDSMYISTFKLNKKTVTAEFTKQGWWERTIYEQTDADLPTSVTNFIKKNYDNQYYSAQKWDLVNADMIYVITIMDEKAKYPIKTIHLNKNGKLIKTIEHEAPVEQNQLIAKTKKTEKVDNIVADTTLVDDSNNYQLNEENDNKKQVKINPKELPTPIHTYLEKNYKDEKIIKSFLINAENTSFYEVQLRKPGMKNITRLKFDLKGKLIED